MTSRKLANVWHRRKAATILRLLSFPPGKGTQFGRLKCSGAWASSQRNHCLPSWLRPTLKSQCHRKKSRQSTKPTVLANSICFLFALWYLALCDEFALDIALCSKLRRRVCVLIAKDRHSSFRGAQ